MKRGAGTAREVSHHIGREALVGTEEYVLRQDMSLEVKEWRNSSRNFLT